MWGNAVWSYLEAAADWVVLWVGFYLVQWVLLIRLEKWVKRTKTDLDNTVIRIVKSIKPPVIFVLSVYLAAQALVLSEGLERLINLLTVIVLSVQVVLILQILLDYLVKRRLQQKITDGTESAQENGQNIESALRMMNQIGRFVLWSVGLLFVLSNLGVNINSLIASLGIGGVAVALAAQSALGDLFSSLVIYFDKPFAVGDFIVTGDVMGTVKYIGIKTTRIKALSGEEIILPNQDITSARISNYKRMEERRVPFKIGIKYETPGDKLKQVPQVIEDIIGKIEQVRFGRAHFESFGDSGLIFEVVYFVTDPSYNLFMDVQQTINFEIKQQFERLGIEFSYPTQTLHIAKN